MIDLHDESFVNANGTAPWTYIDYVDDLSSLMASATSPADWLALIPTAGAQAHYIEDLHNPLHLTTNYNGQETGNYGIHSRYEGGLVWRHFDDLSITPGSAVYQATILEDTFDEMESHYWYVNDILAADTAYAGEPEGYDETYYDGLWSETGTLTQILFQAALRSSGQRLVYRLDRCRIAAHLSRAYRRFRFRRRRGFLRSGSLARRLGGDQRRRLRR